MLSPHVIYEDNHIIVVVKPPKIPSQQDKTQDVDMLTIVKEYLKEKYNKPGEAYVGLLHRLDRMVFGLMVFAKTSKAASRISEYIRNREFKKRYFAIVCGTLQEKQGTLIDFLVKDEKTNKSKVATSSNKFAKEAILEYKVLSEFRYREKQYSLVSVDLKTGRHHQIRVQFSHIGNPLYGDQKYGVTTSKVGENLALCSCYLSFYHPTKDEYLEFSLSLDDIDQKDEIWNYCK